MLFNLERIKAIPDKSEFVRRSSPGEREVVAFLLPQGNYTARNFFSSIRKRNYPFLLESASGIEGIARYSIMGCDPFLVFRSRGRQVIIEEKGECCYCAEAHPLDKLREILKRYKIKKRPDLPGFVGGAVGYFSYDLKNQLEELPDTVTDDLQLPEIFLLFNDTVLVMDEFTQMIWIISSVEVNDNPAASYDKAKEKIESFLENIPDERGMQTDVAEIINSSFPSSKQHFFGKIGSTHSQSEYEKMVLQAKDYIAAGDIYQANLSQRLTAGFSGSPFHLYNLLCNINPSPFAFYFDFNDFQLVSCSPERLVSLDKRYVQTRPIAGTRPRGRNREEDVAMSAELILSPKERAEHVMIVDMSRNDIGRVCEYGTVCPDEFMILESYSHVIHIVSNIVGRIQKSKDALDLLAAVFPGASITGVPKIRCMEIIDELEKVRRGPYTGSAGWLSFSGDMDLNIIIRTFVIKNGLAHIQVGGGIVADSVPEREYMETLSKGQALIDALEKMASVLPVLEETKC